MPPLTLEEEDQAPRPGPPGRRVFPIFPRIQDPPENQILHRHQVTPEIVNRPRLIGPLLTPSELHERQETRRAVNALYQLNREIDQELDSRKEKRKREENKTPVCRFLLPEVFMKHAVFKRREHRPLISPNDFAVVNDFLERMEKGARQRETFLKLAADLYLSENASNMDRTRPPDQNQGPVRILNPPPRPPRPISPIYSDIESESDTESMPSLQETEKEEEYSETIKDESVHEETFLEYLVTAQGRGRIRPVTTMEQARRLEKLYYQGKTKTMKENTQWMREVIMHVIFFLLFLAIASELVQKVYQMKD